MRNGLGHGVRMGVWGAVLVLAGVLLAGCGDTAQTTADVADLEEASALGTPPERTSDATPPGKNPGQIAMEMDADTGEGAVDPAVSQPDPVRIELMDARAFKLVLDADGTMRLDDQPVSKGELPYRFRSIKRSMGDPEMLLRHPEDMSYEKVREIIDMAQDAGIRDINVMTRARVAE